MVNETHEDFGLGDRNFHPEEQRLNSETILNEDSGFNPYRSNSIYKSQERDKDLDNYTRNDYDPYQDDLDDDDVNQNVDEDLDDDGDDFDDDFDEKDKSDY
ncbi:hypothetical protein [Flavobacterium sp. N1736]|uniref:hypothetical protein n=1 Tax=Flavobacterium sp. N1736 TaxID=2986823 RepID=UPI002224AAF1|nr:hypothetical protein [Flavobacterium sp. N1736]